MDQNNQTNQGQQEKSIATQQHFSQSDPFVFVLKKTQRLASAVYLMTNHFPETESLKRTLRDKSSSLVSFIVGYKNLSTANAQIFTKDVEDRVIEIVSLLELSLNVGLISKMNFNVVEEEFLKVVDLIKTRVVSNPGDSGSEAINKHYFNVGESRNSALDSARNSNFGIQNLQHKALKSASLSSIPNSSQEVKRSSRQNVILGLIKKKGEVTVKDVASIIKNCSEKTIQRELQALVNTGEVKRTGERRWSKYSLV